LETSWRCFRNLKPRRQQWCPGLNVFLGPNGSGKTNILESVNVLSGWGAFPVPTNRVSSMISWDCGEERAFLSGHAGGERELEVTAQIGARLSLRAANERVTYSELRALLPSLSFLPSDVELLDGSPSIRRFFLDKLCALSSPLYARRLAEYRQLARQRGALLRRSGDSAALRASTHPMARLGGWIRFVRERTVDLLSKKLSIESDSLESGLLPFNIGVAIELRGGNAEAGFELEDYVENLRSAMESGLERERHAGIVLIGPHRDDLAFSCLGRPAALALSRGQKRRVVMAAILAAGHLIEAKLRVKPMLILDDVAAELDSTGRSLMGQALAATGWQIFAAGVEKPFQTTESTIWHVRDGKILE